MVRICLLGGEFIGSSVDFDWQSGGSYLFSSGSAAGFVAKGGQDLSFSWAKELGGTSSSDVRLRDLSVDGSGAVYATGFFEGSNVSFGATNLSSVGGVGNPDGWVAKIDATGSISWAGSFGATSGGNFGYAIGFDSAGKLWVAGRINGSADIDPGGGTYTVTATGDAGILFNINPATGALANASSPLYYLLDGNNNEEITNVLFGASGEIYLAGYFEGSALNFDPMGSYNPYTSVPTGSIFLAKLYEDGGALKFLYARGFLGGLIASPFALAQQNDKVCLAGGFYNTVDFDPTLSGTDSRTAANASDGFVYLQKPLARYDFVVTDGKTGNPVSGAQVIIETETMTTDAGGVAVFPLPAGTFNYSVTGPAPYIAFFNTLTTAAPSNQTTYEPVSLCPLETPNFNIYVVNPATVAEVDIYTATPSCDYAATEYVVEISETPDFESPQAITAPNDPLNDPTTVSLTAFSLLPETQYYVRVKAKNAAASVESPYAPPKGFVYTENPTGVESARFVRVFPVPAGDRLYVELLHPAKQLRLYDATGKEWGRYVPRKVSPMEIDLRELPQGVYFIEVGFEDLPPLVKKVVKW